MMRKMCALGVTAFAVAGIGLAAPAGATTPDAAGQQADSAQSPSTRESLAGDVCYGQDSTAVNAGAHGVPPRVYRYKDYETPLMNCGPTPVSARIDIAFYPDTPCMTVQPGQTVVFKYRVEWMPKYSPEPGPRGAVQC